MAIDPDKQLLYVFGGRIVNGGHSDSEPMKFSGFYRYNLVTDQWEHILWVVVQINYSMLTME